MNQQTRYRYEKRIKELQDENKRLGDFRRVLRAIYDAIANQVHENGRISQGWILKQISDLIW